MPITFRSTLSLIDAWIEALESGEYKEMPQAANYYFELRAGDSWWTPLGVLCDVVESNWMHRLRAFEVHAVHEWAHGGSHVGNFNPDRVVSQWVNGGTSMNIFNLTTYRRLVSDVMTLARAGKTDFASAIRVLR